MAKIHFVSQREKREKCTEKRRTKEGVQFDDPNVIYLRVCALTYINMSMIIISGLSHYR